MIEDLPALLDVAVFEQSARGLYRPLGALPDWIGLGSGEINLTERFPLLELFFCDCTSVFENGTPPRMESDVWEEAAGDGSTRYLQAVAARLGSSNLIAIKTLPQERFTYQQLFHEFQMAKLVADRATRAKSDFL